jgi:hypothetical protein
VGAIHDSRVTQAQAQQACGCDRARRAGRGARRYALRGYEIRKGERQRTPWLNVDAWYDSGDRLVGLSFHYRGFDFDYVLQ